MCVFLCPPQWMSCIFFPRSFFISSSFFFFFYMRIRSPALACIFVFCLRCAVGAHFAVGIACPSHLVCCTCRVYLCFVVDGHGRRSSCLSLLYEASARTLAALDVDGCKHQFHEKNTHWLWSTINVNMFFCRTRT